MRVGRRSWCRCLKYDKRKNCQQNGHLTPRCGQVLGPNWYGVPPHPHVGSGMCTVPSPAPGFAVFGVQTRCYMLVHRCLYRGSIGLLSSSSYRTSNTYTNYAYLPSPTSFRTCTNRQGSPHKWGGGVGPPKLARNALLLYSRHARWSHMDRTEPDLDLTWTS